MENIIIEKLWLTADEAAKYIGKTKAELEDIYLEGYFQKGKHGLYYRSSLDSWLLGGIKVISAGRSKP